MTNTAVSTFNQSDIDALANQLGVSAEDLTGGGDYLPQLKVNYDEENPETKKELKKGLFFLTNQDVTVFAKSVNFRPLLQHFQWTQWDDDNKITINRTIFITNFRQEAIDEKGSVKCGKPPSKELKDNKELREKYEDITCYRHITGLVSYTGQDENGVEHTVENVVCTLRVKGANFSPFDEEFIKVMPKSSRLWDFSIGLSTTREKNGATYYYVIHFLPDFATRLVMDQTVYDTVVGVNNRMNDINKEIHDKYVKAIASRGTEQAAIDALDITPKDSGRSLDDDLNGDIPF